MRTGGARGCAVVNAGVGRSSPIRATATVRRAGTSSVVDARALGTGKTQIWTVTVSLSNKGDIDSINSALTSAGFTPMKEHSSSGTGSTIVADNKAYSVLVVESQNASGWFANYTVTPDK